MRVLLLVLVACGSAEPPPARTPQQRTEDSAPAVAALQASKFDQAARAAEFALAQDPHNARAAAVHAIATYRAGGNELFIKLEHLVESGEKLKALDHASGRDAWQSFLGKLEIVDRDLAIVAEDRDFSLELCLGCWEQDWNRNGTVDERDRRLFEIERDNKDNELPEGDPRRRPTFRFDVGDAEWGRAMVDFQRATVETILGYRWTELDKLFTLEMGQRLVIHLEDKSRIKRARELLLATLDHADKCRAAYLAETDDDREWVPNPRQKSYAMPLPVDEALYETWHDILGDVRRLLKSEEGISLKEAQALVGADDIPVSGFIDIGAMLRDPKDIVIDTAKLKHDLDVQGLLHDILGNGYRKGMKASPLLGRLARMKGELDRGEDSFEHKLELLLFLN